MRLWENAIEVPTEEGVTSPGCGSQVGSWLGVNGQDGAKADHEGSPAPCWYGGMWNITHTHTPGPAGISTDIKIQRLITAITSESMMVSC